MVRRAGRGGGSGSCSFSCSWFWCGSGGRLDPRNAATAHLLPDTSPVPPAGRVIDGPRDVTLHTSDGLELGAWFVPAGGTSSSTSPSRGTRQRRQPRWSGRPGERAEPTRPGSAAHGLPRLRRQPRLAERAGAHRGRRRGRGSADEPATHRGGRSTWGVVGDRGGRRPPGGHRPPASCSGRRSPSSPTSGPITTRGCRCG